jgi:hypothetical protein
MICVTCATWSNHKKTTNQFHRTKWGSATILKPPPLYYENSTVEEKLTLSIVIYAFHGIRNNANRKDAVLRNLPYLGIAAVGFGSAIFHATMKNYTQWCKLFSFIF